MAIFVEENRKIDSQEPHFSCTKTTDWKENTEQSSGANQEISSIAGKLKIRIGIFKEVKFEIMIFIYIKQSYYNNFPFIPFDLF